MEPLAATDPAWNLRVVLRGPLSHLIAARVSTRHFWDSAMHFEYEDDEWMKRKYFCTRGIYYEDSNTSAMTRGRRNYDDRFDFEPENPKFRPIKYVDSGTNANCTHTWIAELTMIWLLNSGISLSISPMWNLLVTWLVADLLNKYLIQFCHLDNNGGTRTEWSGE